MRFLIIFAGLLGYVFSSTASVASTPEDSAQEVAATIPVCQQLPEQRRKVRQVFKGENFMTLVLLLEEQGRDNLRPEYDPPSSQCIATEFQENGYSVALAYSAYQKGIQTLHLQYLATSEDLSSREFLLLYSGMLSFIHGDGEYFYLVEISEFSADYYAMYKRQPRRKDVTELVKSILADQMEPLVSVDWPENEPELLINDYSDKLK